MILDTNHLDMIYEYIGDFNYLFYSDSMCGKTDAQLHFLARYLYNNEKDVLLLCNNRNILNRITPIIDLYNKPYKVIHIMYPDTIYFGKSKIKIINSDYSLISELRGSNYDILMVDDFNMSLRLDIKDVHEMISLLDVNNTKLILNGTTTSNKKTLEQLSIIKSNYLFKEINNDFMIFVERMEKLNKIKKGLKN